MFQLRNQVALASRDLSETQSQQGKYLKPRNQASQFVDLVIWSIFSPLGQLNAGHFYCEDADFDDSDSPFFVLMNCR